MSQGLVCGYSISGGYGPISRFLYYILLTITLIFHKTEWLVSSSLGASMIFSSIAAVHAVALASARGRGTVDFDIVPVYSITGVGMLISTPLLMWSKTLREARFPTRLLAFAWIALMFVGVMASRASMVVLPTPVDCSDPTTPECPLTCNVSLPMRQSQPIAAYATACTGLGLIFAYRRQHPVKQERKRITRAQKASYADRGVQWAFCTPPLAVGLTIGHLVEMEIIMLGQDGLPLGENETAIGQWGPLVGAAFALIASIIQWTFRQREENVKGDVEKGRTTARSVRAQQPSVLADPKTLPASPLNSASAVTQQDLTANQYDISAYLEEGKWWGMSANGVIINHADINWLVRDGYLRRFVSSDDEDRRPRESGTPIINREETSANFGTTFSQAVGVIANKDVTAEEIEFREQKSDDSQDMQVRSA
ncbi:hypothetical protein CVT26_015860 [Gymnopilus dilepis]|uniref:Uncharacterized protein n=1 Tax=Gymnopilus dilepis TaxID=231916 RepID=A0A409XY88_9AGAR|nr:hypothetical protein CVT26_015860 [Gymnopilus dilepis]